MTMRKTIGILSALVLVAMLIISPTFDHAFAAHSKTVKTTSGATKSTTSKLTIAERNTKTEARHKHLTRG